MDRIKKHTITFFFLLIVNLLAIISILNLSRNYLLKEIEVMLGVASTSSTGTVAVAFERYLALDSRERENNATEGREVIASAGYSYTAPKHLDRGMIGALFPTVFISLLFEVAIAVMLVTQFRRTNDENIQLIRKLAERTEEFNSLKKHHTEMMDEIEQYEENLYHQLKTPLTSLQLCLDQIELLATTKCQNPNSIQMANQQISKLTRMISLFLRDRKLSSNSIKFNYQLVALDCLIEETIQNLQAHAEYKNISINRCYPEHDCFLQCDETWLAECLVALVENAVEHSPKNCSIVVLLIHDDGKYRIKIGSSGKFLESNEFSKIFTRFYSSTPEHFGIGLHMAKMIAENHHGKLTAYNTSDTVNGICFELNLPILHGEEVYSVT